MRRRISAVLAVLAMTLIAGSVATPAAAAASGAATYEAAARRGCPDGADPNIWSRWAVAKASKEIGISGSRVELRGVDSYITPDDVGCAWGRLVGSTMKGRSVWVDRSFDGGRTWQGPLQKWTIPHEYGRNYTNGVNPFNAVVRACTKSGEKFFCTDWVGIS